MTLVFHWSFYDNLWIYIMLPFQVSLGSFTHSLPNFFWRKGSGHLLSILICWESYQSFHIPWLLSTAPWNRYYHLHFISEIILISRVSVAELSPQSCWVAELISKSSFSLMTSIMTLPVREEWPPNLCHSSTSKMNMMVPFKGFVSASRQEPVKCL